MLAIDAFESTMAALLKIEEVLISPLGKEIGWIKLNDILHIKDLPSPVFFIELKKLLKKLNREDICILLDMKLADVTTTLINILKHYPIDSSIMVTLRESCSVNGYVSLRETFPDLKISLVSLLTDIKPDECRRRYGMVPWIKIANDITNLELEYKQVKGDWWTNPLFDFIVCSVDEVDFLRKIFGNTYNFMCPGIQDLWMKKNHQARVSGMFKAYELGIYPVTASQLLKGNPDNDISSEKSRELTMIEIDKYYKSVDPLEVLKERRGYYQGSSLVAYAGKDEKGRNKVGYTYFNIARVEPNPSKRKFYAQLIASSITKNCAKMPTKILAAPMGGIIIGVELGRLLNIDTIFAEKVITRLADVEKGIKEESKLVIKRHEITPGDVVLVGEDICNNISTAAKIKVLIEAAGGEMVGICCVINRSESEIWSNNNINYPIVSAAFVPSPQYTQDNKEVQKDLAEGNIFWNPKDTKEWQKLMEIMG